MTGLPASVGSRSTSTATKKESMSTWSTVAWSRANAHHRDRRQGVAVHLIAIGARLLPPLVQPGAEGLAHPRLAGLEVAAAGVKGHEAGVDDDAVGVVHPDVAVEGGRPEDLDPQQPP